MAIVKQTNKKTGVTYVYESHSYRDKETKQPRAKRKLIGRIDDETGEIIPTRKRKDITTSDDSHVDTTNTDSSALIELLKEKDDTIKKQTAEIKSLRAELTSLADTLEKLSSKLKTI